MPQQLPAWDAMGLVAAPVEGLEHNDAPASSATGNTELHEIAWLQAHSCKEKQFASVCPTYGILLLPCLFTAICSWHYFHTCCWASAPPASEGPGKPWLAPGSSHAEGFQKSEPSGGLACAGSLAGPTTSGRTLSKNCEPQRLRPQCAPQAA